MKWILGPLLVAVAVASTARGEDRNPAPERVTVTAAVGLLAPIDRFGDLVDGGPFLSFGGFYRLNQWVAPAFAGQLGFLEPVTENGSVDTWRVLGGVRVFLVPRDYFLRPWLTAMSGWAHYTSHRSRPGLVPVFGRNRGDRDDAMLGIGGGIDIPLHPNFEIGFDVRHETSFTDDRENGERDLHAVSVLGVMMLNY